MSKPYRFISPKGDLNVERHGAQRALFNDAYHALLALKWRSFFLWLTAIYLLINLVFASLYWFGGDCLQGAEAGSLSDAFFFSVQTLSTIGYGALSPKTFYADCVAATEAFVGMLVTAMSTGLLFAKFSRPTARVQFTERAVVRELNGAPTLMFRAANMRRNQIVDATLSVVLARFESTVEGDQYRRFYELEMHRSQNSMFVLTWTAMHTLDERSPLYHMTPEAWRSGQAEIIVLLSGVDGTFGQIVHARHSYVYEDLVYDARFKDMLHVDEDGVLQVDYSAFQSILEL